MTVSSAGGDVALYITAQAAIQKEAELQRAVNIAILSDTLDFQRKLVSELLQSSGIGQKVDVTV